MATPELSKKQIEFWVIMFLIILGIMMLITVVDISTKTAIIEQATRLRLLIEGQVNGQNASRTDETGTSSDPIDDGSVPGDVLVFDDARLEAGNVANGNSGAVANSRTRRRTDDGTASDTPPV
jgi:hypothetical protein